MAMKNELSYRARIASLRNITNWEKTQRDMYISRGVLLGAAVVLFVYLISK